MEQVNYPPTEEPMGWSGGLVFNVAGCFIKQI